MLTACLDEGDMYVSNSRLFSRQWRRGSAVAKQRTASIGKRLAALAFVGAHAIFMADGAMAQSEFRRLQLMQTGQFLDADHCGPSVAMNPGSTWEGGACQMWRFVPAGGGWFRIQLAHNGHFLDADHCGEHIATNPGSNWAGGACQLWQIVPAGGGWFRLRLQYDGRFLDADHCSARVTLNPGSDFNGGACQLWREIQ
jgi:hypothetical protein